MMQIPNQWGIGSSYITSIKYWGIRKLIYLAAGEIVVQGDMPTPSAIQQNHCYRESSGLKLIFESNSGANLVTKLNHRSFSHFIYLNIRFGFANGGFDRHRVFIYVVIAAVLFYINRIVLLFANSQELFGHKPVDVGGVVDDPENQEAKIQAEKVDAENPGSLLAAAKFPCGGNCASDTERCPKQVDFVIQKHKVEIALSCLLRLGVY